MQPAVDEADTFAPAMGHASFVVSLRGACSEHAGIINSTTWPCSNPPVDSSYTLSRGMQSVVSDAPGDITSEVVPSGAPGPRRISFVDWP